MTPNNDPTPNNNVDAASHAEAAAAAAAAATASSSEVVSDVDTTLSYSYLHDNPSHNDGDGATSVTGHAANHHYSQDATATVHEMHLALLYLLSHPEEFAKCCVHSSLSPHHDDLEPHHSSLQDWNNNNNNNEETESIGNESHYTSHNNSTTDVVTTTTPLPLVVFADDAEVVLPQAHTASQLFGLERLDGIELEAAAGIPALSQLFLRWLALMPGGDHLNLIDPPGLTVMRIAGGRYRVTAAHRVVWTWMNEFAHLNVDDPMNALQVGDLVTMTIVDVFETDQQGKLLSYCPTFDNRAIRPTHHAAESFRKSSQKVRAMLGAARQSPTALSLLARVQQMTNVVKHRVDQALQHHATTSSPSASAAAGGRHQNWMEEKKTSSSSPVRSTPPAIQPALSAVEAADEIRASQLSTVTSAFSYEDDGEQHEI